MSNRTKDLDTLNEQAALRWFLFVFRLCQPQVLEDLAVEGAARLRDDGPSVFRRWYSDWTERHLLPATGVMRRETEDTLTYGYLDGSERRWHFELPPKRSKIQTQLSTHLENLTGGWSASVTPVLLPVRAEFPPFPLYGSDDERSRYRRRFQEHSRKILNDLEEIHTLMMESASEALRPEAAWLLLPFSGESLTSKRPVKMVARDLVLLAMKQAGASYSEIPRKFASTLRGHVPEEFLEEHNLPGSEKGLRPAVHAAARSIGLPEDRIRKAKPGPRPRE